MKKGFTLAEVLITLGIVGVVAVLTIPSVIQNYRARMFTTQIHKVYAQLTSAAQQIMTDEHTDNFFETRAGQNDMSYFLTHYFKTLKTNCRTGANKCIADQYKSLEDENLGNGFIGYCVQLTSGATICASYLSNNYWIFVDTNGPAGPNMAGRDAFSLTVDSQGNFKDAAILMAGNWNCTTNNNSVMHSAYGCLQKLIDAGWKMEY